MNKQENAGEEESKKDRGSGEKAEEDKTKIGVKADGDEVDKERKRRNMELGTESGESKNVKAKREGGMCAKECMDEMKKVLACKKCNRRMKQDDKLSWLVASQSCGHTYCGHCMINNVTNNRGPCFRWIKCVTCGKEKSTFNSRPNYNEIAKDMDEKIEELEGMMR